MISVYCILTLDIRTWIMNLSVQSRILLGGVYSHGNAWFSIQHNKRIIILTLCNLASQNIKNRSQDQDVSQKLQNYFFTNSLLLVMNMGGITYQMWYIQYFLLLWPQSPEVLVGAPCERIIHVVLKSKTYASLMTGVSLNIHYRFNSLPLTNILYTTSMFILTTLKL